MKASARGAGGQASGALIDKARAVTERVIALHGRAAELEAELDTKKAEFARALGHSRAIAYEAQAREAAARSALTDAVLQAMRDKAEALGRSRSRLADLYFPEPPPPWRGRARVFRWLERIGYLSRKLPPLFDAGFYAVRHAVELTAARMGPIAHFMAVGQARGADPHPLFDMRHYAGQGPKALRGEHLVSHYLREGWRLGLSPHRLFDPVWYAAQAGPDAAESPPLIHYLERGWRAGLSPHPLFDPSWYLQANPDVAASGAEPLSHFVAHGAIEGRSPNPWFDIGFYAAARGEALAPDRNALVDYLEVGAWALATPLPGFATAAYVAAHPELAAEGVTPLEHWVRRNPAKPSRPAEA